MKPQESAPRRILIVKLSAIGDVVQTLPMVEALKAYFPEAAIDWAVEEEASDLLLGHPALNRVIISRRRSWQKKIWVKGERAAVFREIRGFLRDLRRMDYDWVIDNHGIAKSAMIVFLSRGRRKIGFQASRGIADEGSYLFTRERYPALGIERPALERYLDLAGKLGVPAGTPRLHFPVDPGARVRITERLDAGGFNSRPLVVIHPMAKWATKNWPPERFASLAERLLEKGRTVVFTGSPADLQAVEEIRGQIRDRGRAANWAGKTTLRELAALFSTADLVVSTDTGPMHLAAAAGAPLVALFGPTAPWRTGPYGDGHTVLRKEISCSPCFRKECESMECMRTMEMAEVLEAIEQKLNRTIRDI